MLRRVERLERSSRDNGTWLFVVAGGDDAPAFLRSSGHSPSERDLVVQLVQFTRSPAEQPAPHLVQAMRL